MIFRPSLPLPRTRPGRYFSIGASRSILPSPTSCSTTTAVNILVLLAMRTCPLTGTFALVFRSATPAV